MHLLRTCFPLAAWCAQEELDDHGIVLSSKTFFCDHPLFMSKGCSEQGFMLKMQISTTDYNFCREHLHAYVLLLNAAVPSVMDSHEAACYSRESTG